MPGYICVSLRWAGAFGKKARTTEGVSSADWRICEIPDRASSPKSHKQSIEKICGSTKGRRRGERGAWRAADRDGLGLWA
jgi:hypothetical protein